MHAGCGDSAERRAGMAVDLTSRFRRMHSGGSLRRRGHLEPFHATQLWNNLIHVLQTQVEVRQYRRFWRTHSGCFTGADAVDVVLNHLMQNVYFMNSDLSRLKAARLCQALMDHRVFERVSTRLFGKEQQMVFEDGSGSLYRLLDDSGFPGGKQGTEVFPHHERWMLKKKCPRPDKITFSNPIALEACDKRIEEILQAISLRPSLPTNLQIKAQTSLLPKKVIEDVWKQATLLQLLHLIHLPILDSILEPPLKMERRGAVHSNWHTDLIISNTFLDREVSKSLNLPFTDEWLLAAVDCLDYFPDQLIVHASEMLSQTTNDGDTAEAYKRVLFETMVKHYRQNREPLLCSWYRDILSEIIKLLENGKIAQALEATQLCLQLLEPNWREELHRLLSFMAVASSPGACRLRKQYTNRTVMRRTFTKAIVQNKSLSKIQTEELVMFLVDNHTEVFKVPSSLLQMVRRKLLPLQEGKNPNASAGFTFCKHVTQKEFEEQKHWTTLDQLHQLIQGISQNRHMGEKEKQCLLQEFQEHHPSVFSHHFPNLERQEGVLEVQQLPVTHLSGTMESMLNKLKSTVTKVTADVTSAVMGNPVTREFEVGRHIASGGSGMAWKIFHGVKKSTKQEVSVFVFDKKLIEKYQKFEKDHIIESLKKGVQQLTRLRHPRLLTVQHPLEESRDCLAFCTEPVFASLANVLGCYDHLPSPVPPEIKEHKLYDVEIKYGLLQICEGLSFLHSSVKMIHGNLTPENIILNKNGAWKIMGFDFCISTSNSSEQELKFTCKEWDPNLPILCLPNPEYVAPEYILSVSCDLASDMYSLGGVMFTVFNDGKPIFEVNKQDIFKSFSRQLDQLTRLGPNILQKVPEEAREHLKLLLNVTPAVRPDADQLCKIPFFDDVGTVTLQYFDSLFQRDNLQKSQFYKGLPKILPKLPKRVVLQRILPSLMSEFVNPDMVPFVLPNVLLVVEECTKEEYVKLILPDLVPVFKLQEPIQASNMVLLIFLQKMDLLLTKTPAEDIKSTVLPMIYRALEAPSIQIQELCLNIIPTFANLIDYPSMKNSLIPRIKSASLQTSSLAVRVNSLVCLGKLLEYLDKWFVLDEILPFLQQIPSREPAVLMGILGIYKCSFSHKKLGITKEQLASKVLPHLVPLSIDNNLNLNQFNSFMGVIKEMLSKLEAEHKTKLEQLHSLQEQQRSMDLPSQFSKAAEPQETQDNQIDKIFSGFGVEVDKEATKKENGMVSNVQKSAKAPLTLEEKQRLAKAQEQAQKLRNQKPLAPTAVKVSAPTSQTKNLTSSLLENMTSMNSLSLNSSKLGCMQAASTSGFPAPCLTNSTMGFSKPSASLNALTSTSNGVGFGPVSPFQSTYSNSLRMGSTGQSFYTGRDAPGISRMPVPSAAGLPGFSGQAGRGSPASQPNRAMDMSALDNLLGPQKSKVSMNQMGQAGPHNQWLSQFTPAKSSPMGLGQPAFPLGPLPTNPFMSPQNLTQAGLPTNSMTPSTSANNDLKDLFG
ncbi:SCY1-like protein 2 isoform X2 [Narcine bancroftii]|uniref:SCY1-like protein 2 isoform X2 n=1 Tax=Narcine bancroftii TaxID=1343680 RepID=UPI003831D57F